MVRMTSKNPEQRHTASPRWNVWTAWAILALVVFNFLIPPSNAGTLPSQNGNIQPREAISDGVEIRVLPIGDSITWGAQSTDETGYRKSLFSQLINRGNKVDFVGGTSSGQMADNDHEGHRGHVIDEISDESNHGIYAAANIVLLHAGTNDMKNNIDPSNAPLRLKKLIDKILKHSENAVILVCQIIPADPARYSSTVPRIKTFNEAIPDLVKDYVSKGKKVMMVSMNKAISITDLADGLHPNDNGYSKMAKTYFEAIEEADEKHWISKPGKEETPSASSGLAACKSTQLTSEGPFKPLWAKRGVVAEGDCPSTQLHFMDLDGDGLKDYACVNEDTGELKVHLNVPDSEGKTSGKWKELGSVASPMSMSDRNGTGVMFADLNGDGRDDYIYVNPKDGEVSAWINRLEKDSVWQWERLERIAGGIGTTYDTLQIVDIDGDGRVDLCVVDKDTGEVSAWLNTGAGTAPNFDKAGRVATGATAKSGDIVRLGDFTGDGRADYMIIGASGEVVGFVNHMISQWSEPLVLFEGPDDAKQDQVRLVDMKGDGRVDYLLVDRTTGKVTLWENTSTGGKYRCNDDRP